MSPLFIYLSDFTYSSIYAPFFFSTRLQMRVCTEQIRQTQPRTEGTGSTRSERRKSTEEEEEEEEAPRHTALTSVT